MFIRSYIAKKFGSSCRMWCVDVATRPIYTLLYLPLRKIVAQFVGWQFDRTWDIETTRTVEHRKDSGDPLRLTAVMYEPTSPQLFRKIAWSLKRLPTQRSPAQLSFFDVGCGNGRVLLMATQHGFRHVAGIEFAPELVAVAKKMWRVLNQTPRHVES